MKTAPAKFSAHPRQPKHAQRAQIKHILNLNPDDNKIHFSRKAERLNSNRHKFE